MNNHLLHKINYILLLLLAAVLAASFFSEASPSITVKEVRHTLAGKTEVERCVSCHSAQVHPPTAGHDPMAESCVVCHNGKGLAITAQKAHFDGAEAESRNAGLSARAKGHSPNALLTEDEVSAACLRCHPPQQLEPAAAAVQGWRLFNERACGRCHQIDQVSSGAMGPDLSNIGDVRGMTALRTQLAAPQTTGFYSVMPTMPLTDEERRQLALFLQGQSRLDLRPVGYRVEQVQPKDPLARFACLACHKYQANDGGVGPDLNMLSSTRTTEWLSGFLQSPETLRPGARMPALGGTEDVRAVVETFFTSHPRKLTPTSMRETYEQLCARCHGVAGDGMGPIALELATAPRRFLGNPGYFRLVDQSRLRASVQKGIAGTAMAPFAGVLTDGQIDALLDDIARRFAGIAPAEKVMDIGVVDRPAVGPGDGAALYASLCAKCHGETGDQAVRKVHNRFPQPRNLRNRAYMSTLSDHQLFRAIARGIPGTRMKAYQQSLPGTGVRLKADLRDGDIWRLVDHVRSLADE